MLALDLLIALFLIGTPAALAARASGAAALALLALFAARRRARAERATIRRRHCGSPMCAPAMRGSIAHRQRGLQALSQMLTDAHVGRAGRADRRRSRARRSLGLSVSLLARARRRRSVCPTRRSPNIDRYLAIGGLLLVDTRDAGARVRRSGRRRRCSPGVDVPPLEQVTTEHVVARAFYLMRSFPGRTQATQLWAESARAPPRRATASRRSSSAMAIGPRPGRATQSDGGDRQRELSLRFGVNLVMVALTGNYKADQVHVPALLERMGARRDDRRGARIGFDPALPLERDDRARRARGAGVGDLCLARRRRADPARARASRSCLSG